MEPNSPIESINPYRKSNKLRCPRCMKIKICPRFNDLLKKDGTIEISHYMKEHKDNKGSTCNGSDKIIYNSKKFFDGQPET